MTKLTKQNTKSRRQINFEKAMKGRKRREKRKKTYTIAMFVVMYNTDMFRPRTNY
jgi:hypothetical protein